MMYTRVIGIIRRRSLRSFFGNVFLSVSGFVDASFGKASVSIDLNHDCIWAIGERAKLYVARATGPTKCHMIILSACTASAPRIFMRLRCFP